MNVFKNYDSDCCRSHVNDVLYNLKVWCKAKRGAENAKSPSQ
uniref:Uncharacterized protein n=1 Tax=Romanomermis culicivorax TaxID=13658 RepID=A0A915JPI1_ROMCU